MKRCLSKSVTTALLTPKTMREQTHGERSSLALVATAAVAALSAKELTSAFHPKQTLAFASAR